MEVEVLRFLDNLHMKSYALAAFTPQGTFLVLISVIG